MQTEETRRRMKTIKFITTLIIIISSTISLKAEHIFGGDLSSKHISGNDFEITLKLFRDCNGVGANFDDSIQLIVFDALTDAVVSTHYITQSNDSIIDLGDSCFTPSICVQEGRYTDTITLSNNPNGYYIAWERCCRPSNIVNIETPGDVGMAFCIAVPDPMIQNSNPEFGQYPASGYLCLNTLTVIDFNVTEPDGDSLVFSLVDPLKGDLTSPFNPNPDSALSAPYSTIQWKSPYSLSDIVGGDSAMMIDSATGIITATPKIQGNFTFAVLVEEYRAGVKIGETRREITYQVMDCTQDAPPNFVNSVDTLYLPVLSSFCLDLAVSDSDSLDTVIFTLSSATFDLGATSSLPAPTYIGADTIYTLNAYKKNAPTEEVILKNIDIRPNHTYVGLGKAGAIYCWQTECEDISNDPHIIHVESYALGCNGSDTNIMDIGVILYPDLTIFDNIPNVFTPNSDKKNDEIEILGAGTVCLDYLNVKVYNRWGKLVAESKDLDFSWNGNNLSGQKLSTGTYFMTVSASFGDQEFEQTTPISVFE